MRMCACTSILHAQNRQEEKRKGGCLLARSLVYRARFIFASKRASTNGHVCITMGCGTRSMVEKGGEGRGKEGRAREVKNIESERVSEQTIVSFGVSYLLLLLITDSTQYWSSKEKTTTKNNTLKSFSN